jgi:hypothetical protein
MDCVVRRREKQFLGKSEDVDFWDGGRKPRTVEGGGLFSGCGGKEFVVRG